MRGSPRPRGEGGRRSGAIGRGLLAHAAGFEFFTRSTRTRVVPTDFFSKVADRLSLPPGGLLATGDGGLLRYTLYDLRRVSGTTDVEQGAQAGGALIEGRDVRRILRRRIQRPEEDRVPPKDVPRFVTRHRAYQAAAPKPAPSTGKDRSLQREQFK